MDYEDHEHRFEDIGYIIELENNDPEDTHQHKRLVARCNGCKSLVLEADQGDHVCIGDLIADEIRALRSATDSYVGYAVEKPVGPSVRGVDKMKLFAQHYGGGPDA